jgi:hypothetical protein
MTAPTIYRSTDASAPVLTGEIGKLVALLDACLVNGYGAKAAAGWTKEYSGANYAAYRQGSGLMHYLQVNDTAAQMARVVGYSAMTGILDGTGPFPTEAQVSGGLYVRKSVTASATARPWILFATEQVFYLFVFGNATVFGNFDGGDSHLGFGQLNSFLTGDTAHAFLQAATDTSTTSTTATATRQVLAALGVTGGHYLEAIYTQAGGSATFIKRPQSNLFSQTFSGLGGLAYPDPVSGSLLIEPMVAQEAANSFVRGTLPGLFDIAHVATSFAQFDTFSGKGSLVGTDFMIVRTGTTWAVAIQTTGDWHA